ncbi:MAG: hypothetical protein LBM66_06190 [Bifidobacteriaceae bacterium]|jgi:hypothetical protein|nr:hypothetical protein [Bifidobacteriaceae bacterium]
MAKASIADDESKLDALAREQDDIFDGLVEHLEGVIPDAFIESATDDQCCGEEWCAIVYLVVIAGETNKLVDSQVIALAQRALDLTHNWDVDEDESVQDDVDSLTHALTKLKQRSLVAA